MADLIASIFAIHHPNWEDVQALPNILLTTDERQLVINKGNEEAQSLHQKNPNGIPNLAGAIPSIAPDWNQNCGNISFLEHYRKYILEGLKEGVPKGKSLNMIQVLQQKTNEDLSEFLERIYQTYRKHTEADSQAPEKCVDGEHDFYWIKCPGY